LTPREATLVLSLVLLAVGVLAVLFGIAVVSPALAVAVAGLMAVGAGIALFPVRDQ
jgi:hypothetical protein